MVAAELLILGVLNVICLLSIVSLGLWLRIELANMLELLDERLAMALKSTIDRLMDGGIGDFEPPNPIQGAIAQLIQGMAAQKMNTIDAVSSNRQLTTFNRIISDFVQFRGPWHAGRRQQDVEDRRQSA